MNYIERHIGDYLKDTAHLSLLEHGVYARLMDVYYVRETGIPEVDAARLIGARSKEEREALANVLLEFFDLQDGIYRQARCDREIERYLKRVEHNRDVGKLGGRPRQKETHMVSKQKPENNPVGFQKKPADNPNLTLSSLQSPDTSLQSPEREEDGGAAQAPTPPPPTYLGDKNESQIHAKAMVKIDLEWELPEKWGLDAERLGWKPAEILREAEKFRQYWTVGKGEGTRRSLRGWRTSWSNWLGKAEKMKGRA